MILLVILMIFNIIIILQVLQLVILYLPLMHVLQCTSFITFYHPLYNTVVFKIFDTEKCGHLTREQVSDMIVSMLRVRHLNDHIKDNVSVLLTPSSLLLLLLLFHY